MNIVMTVHHALDANAGAPGVTLRLASEYRKLGHDVTLLSFDDLPRNVPPKLKPLLFPFFVARWMRGCRRPIDVLDASTGDAWIWAAQAPRSRTTLYVCRSHGLEHTSHDRAVEEARKGVQTLSWKYPIYHGGYRLWEVTQSLRRADLVLLLNREDLGYAATRLRVPRDRLRVVPNGLPEEFLALPAPDEERPDEIWIAQVGAFIERKGIAYGCKALNSVLTRHPEVRVLFVGTGVDSAHVHSAFEPRLHERVHVTPAFDNRQLPMMLKRCQIKFFPTLSEGFGIALLEAMACGLAPITTTAPGPSMFVRNLHSGLLVPPADAIALEDALERLLNDPALLRELRRNAHADAQSYGWSRVARDQVELFDEYRSRRNALAA
jgi:glycosyltransferase involved in cell wall biosynthesis